MLPCWQPRSAHLYHQDESRTCLVRHLQPLLPYSSAAANLIHAQSPFVDSPAYSDIFGTVHIAFLHHHTITSAISALYHKSSYPNGLIADSYLVPRFSVALVSWPSPSSRFLRLYRHHRILAYGVSPWLVKLTCALCLYIRSSLGFDSVVLLPLDFECISSRCFTCRTCVRFLDPVPACRRRSVSLPGEFQDEWGEGAISFRSCSAPVAEAAKQRGGMKLGRCGAAGKRLYSGTEPLLTSVQAGRSRL